LPNPRLYYLARKISMPADHDDVHSSA
jgi:hypothetical protein